MIFFSVEFESESFSKYYLHHCFDHQLLVLIVLNRSSLKEHYCSRLDREDDD